MGGEDCERNVLHVIRRILCFITKLLEICAPPLQLRTCLHIINYLAERLGWKEYGWETQLESWELVPSEIPSEPEAVKLRNGCVNLEQEGSQFPRVEYAGTLRRLARLDGWVSGPFTRAGKVGGRTGRRRYEWGSKEGSRSVWDILNKRCLWDIKVEKKV